MRIQNSWHRRGKAREDFDIVNAVQCFPGNDGKRDFKPNPGAKACCAKRLNGILEQGIYRGIVVFGDVAFEMVNSLMGASGMNSQLIRAAHPNGGVSNSTLDSLW